MRVAVFLFSLFAVITGFLIWRRIPRPLVFAVLLGSATTYALSYFVRGWALYAIDHDLLDRFVPYLLPIPLVVLYIAWTFRRHYKALDRERTQV